MHVHHSDRQYRLYSSIFKINTYLEPAWPLKIHQLHQQLLTYSTSQHTFSRWRYLTGERSLKNRPKWQPPQTVQQLFRSNEKRTDSPPLLPKNENIEGREICVRGWLNPLAKETDPYRPAPAWGGMLGDVTVQGLNPIGLPWKGNLSILLRNRGGCCLLSTPPVFDSGDRESSGVVAKNS